MQHNTPMQRRIGLILLFYRSFALPSNLATGLCIWIIIRHGGIALSPALVLKAAILGLCYWFGHEYGGKTLYYYTNRGLSPRTLWIVALGLDLMIFFVCATASIAIHYI